MAQATGGLLPLARFKVQTAESAETSLHELVKFPEGLAVSCRRAAPHGVHQAGKARSGPEQPQGDLRIMKFSNSVQKLAGSFNTAGGVCFQKAGRPMAAPRNSKSSKHGSPIRLSKQSRRQVRREGGRAGSSNCNSFTLVTAQSQPQVGRSLLQRPQSLRHSFNGASQDPVNQVEDGKINGSISQGCRNRLQRSGKKQRA